MTMQRINARPHRVGMDWWLDRMQAAIDELDRSIKASGPCFDNPAIAEQDRINSLPEPPEPEDNATGTTR